MRKALLVPVAALLLMTPAAAVPPAGVAAEPDTIVVTGDRPDRATIRKAASAFVRAVAVAPGELPAARWVDPVCPRVFGLDERHARRSAERIRARAAAVGARLAGPRCKANFALVFSADGADMARRLGAPPAIDQRPVRWWYGVEVRSRDGMRGTEAPLPWASGDSPGGGSALPSGDGGGALNHYNSSLISTMEIRAVGSVVVVVDVDKASGATLDAVSDYAAFVGLARLRLPPNKVENSILALFDGERGRRAMSDRDLAFLRTLYAMPLDRTARRHRAQLVGGMVKASVSGDDDAAHP